VVHAEQGVEWRAPLPAAGTVHARNEIAAIVDKGPQIGALIYQRRLLVDASSGASLATVEQTILCRGDGGLERSDPAPARVSPPPRRAADLVAGLPLLPQAALIYRLSGDLNPLHVDPQRAAVAGFERPIAHGLLTYAVAIRILVDALAGRAPERLRSVRARFAAPVFPGETLNVEAWDVGGGMFRFQARAAERDQLVLTGGTAQLN
jgi:acyl dehydratase